LSWIIVSKILIVDDDQSVRDMMRLRLESAYQVSDTGNPEEALALALQLKPDCILLDLTMPKFSGFELCQTLVSFSHTQNIPILIVSGEPASRYEAFCQSLGAAGYFEKPVNFEALKARLVQVINKKLKEFRAEARVRLKVSLKLKGAAADGSAFEEVTHSENVSASGFRCICLTKLVLGSTVEVFTLPESQQFVGQARVMWIDPNPAPWPTAGFRFLHKPRSWVLQ
jgi:DNA-binding response OmpR family regulator